MTEGQIEAYAIRIAMVTNPGANWKTSLTDHQRDLYRQIVRDLINEIKGSPKEDSEPPKPVVLPPHAPVDKKGVVGKLGKE
jgi:hypothetical protein